MKRTVILSAFIDRVCTKLHKTVIIFFPFGLETSDRSKPAKCLSPRKGRNEIIFLSFLFLVWPYNKQLINRARSVCMGES